MLSLSTKLSVVVNLSPMVNSTIKGPFEPRHEKTRLFAYAKTKTHISFAVTAKLISAFVFRYIDSTIPLLSKSEISSL